jgi:hypothetical protein
MRESSGDPAIMLNEYNLVLVLLKRHHGGGRLKPQEGENPVFLPVGVIGRQT